MLPPQPQWQAQPPYAQAPPFQSQMPPASQVGIQQPTNGTGVGQHAVAGPIQGGGGTGQANVAVASPISPTPAAAPLDTVPASVTSNEPAGPGPAQENPTAGSGGAAGNVGVGVENGTDDRDGAKSTPTGGEVEGGISNAGDQRGDDGRQQGQGEAAKPQSAVVDAGNPSVETGNPQPTTDQIVGQTGGQGPNGALATS
jgi:hypothetical protein